MALFRTGLLATALLAGLVVACTDTQVLDAAVERDPGVDDQGGDGHDHAGHDEAHDQQRADEQERPSPRQTTTGEVTVVATDHRFSPDTVQVEVGEPLTIRLRNDGTAHHDLVLDPLGLHLHADPGHEDTGVVTLDEPGRHVATCSQPGHAEAGMQLVIVAS